MTDCDKNIVIPASDRKWQYFVAASAVIYFGGLILVLIGRLLYMIVKRSTRRHVSVSDVVQSTANKKDEAEDASWYVALKEGAGALVSAQTLQGRILVVLAFISSLSACALYITESSFPVEHCLDINDQILWRFEICLNIFFIFHFIIRFIAANDKLVFWTLDYMSYIDYLTIPPVFVALVIRRNWIGLRFLRALELIKLAEILQFLNVLSTGSSVEMARICGNFFALWLSSAGFVHLLETTGDFWPPINYKNAQKINYFESIYFLLVTMSTVGYGDLKTETYLGRVFTMIFICVGLGLFASYIPAILDFASSHTKYNRSFTPTPGRKHIVVCGHITEESVSMFVRDFLHPDREDARVIIVFLGPTFPSISLQAILKKYSTRTAYFIGTVFNFRDCARIKNNMILELICTLVAGLLAFLLISYIIQLSQLSRYPPGPIPLPLLGNLHLLGTHAAKSLIGLAKQYGNVMSITFGTERIVVISTIELAREALIQKGEDFGGRPTNIYLPRLVTRGCNSIATGDYGVVWKKMRKVAHSSLRMYGAGMEKLESSILIEIEELFKRFDAKAGKPFYPHDDIALGVLNVICFIMFGHRYDIKDEDFQQLIEFATTLANAISNASILSFMPWLRVFPSKNLDAINGSISLRDRILRKEVEEHRATMDPSNLRDFTDALLSEMTKEENEESTKYLNETRLEMILSDLVLGGQETTSTTILWSMVYLVTWPEVQSKIAHEMKHVLGERQPRVADRANLPYLDATIHETLRLSSILPLSLPHRTTCDTAVGGFRIPKGTQILFNHWAFHHDKRHWAEPESFKPERWLNEEGKVIPGANQSFLPFSAGRRVCLGEALAKMELFLILSNILHRYEIQKDSNGKPPDVNGIATVTHSPKPFQIVLKQRS